MSIEVLCPFFNQVIWLYAMSYRSSLYIFKHEPFLWYVVYKYFSLSVDCLLTLLTVYIFLHKLFSFWSSLSIFHCLCFYVIANKSFPRPKSWCFPSMFSSKSFTVLTFPFGSRFILSKFLCRVWERGLPWWLNGKESAYQCRRHKRYRFDFWIRKIPWSRKWQFTPVLLPGKPHG